MILRLNKKHEPSVAIWLTSRPSLPPSASGGFAKAPRLSRQEGEQGGLI